jgi:hypothetical protein
VLIPSFRAIRSHFSEAWNVLDACGLTLVVVWAFLVVFTHDDSSFAAEPSSLPTSLPTMPTSLPTFSPTGSNPTFLPTSIPTEPTFLPTPSPTSTFSPTTADERYGNIGCLTCSSIFFTFGLLRFTSVYEGLGKLIVMLFAIIYELRSILFLFVICMYGFCLVQYTLFRNSENSDEYKSFQGTFLTQFSAALNNYEADFGVFKGSEYAAVGIVVQVYIHIYMNISE